MPIASLLAIPPLKLDKNVGPLCTFSANKPTRYLITVDITVIPYSDSVWASAVAAAQKRHEYSQSNANLFFGDRSITSTNLPPCDLGDKKAGQIGPKCGGEPTQNVYTVVGRGPYKSTGTKLMVTAATSAQSGDIYLGHVIELVQEIIAGKIH